MSDAAKYARWTLQVEFLPGEFAICRLPPHDKTPDWLRPGAGFQSVTRTDRELSVICPARDVPAGVSSVAGWRVARLEGTFPVDSTGVLASVVGPLAEAGVSVVASATFDTDYFLVPSGRMDVAIKALCTAGHSIRGL